MDTPSRKIILQTKSVRVIHIPRVSTLPESAGKPDNILIERRERDGMGELHWERFIELAWTESFSAFGDLMHQMFNQLVGDVDHEMAIQTSLGALPIIERQNINALTTVPGSRTGLARLLNNMNLALDRAHDPMPFDNREGEITLQITPAQRVELMHLFPDQIPAGAADPTASDLVRRLLHAVVQELLK